MKKIWFFVAFIAITLSLNFVAIAQQGRGPRNFDPKEMAERQTNQMEEVLKLTAEQLPKVEALNLEYAQKMKEARDEAGDDREAMRANMRKMMQAKDVELKKILTAEQWTTLEAERKQRMENRRGGGGRRGI